jgi:hypothetical protein
MGDAPVVETDRERGFLTNLFGLYLSPDESFADILKRPRFWVALAGVLALSIAFCAVWLQKVDPGEFVKAMLEDSGRWEQIPADRRAAILEGAGRSFAVQAWVGGVAGPLVVMLLIALVLLFVFRFFYGGEVTFPQAMTIVCYTFLAIGLVKTPLMLAVMALKGDWNLDPRHVLQANPTLLVDKDSVAKPLYALLGYLDLFPIWNMVLLAVGFGVAVRRPTSSALWGVVIPWAIFVAGAVALGSLF